VTVDHERCRDAHRLASLRRHGDKALRGVLHVERSKLNGHHPGRLVERPVGVEPGEVPVGHSPPFVTQSDMVRTLCNRERCTTGKRPSTLRRRAADQELFTVRQFVVADPFRWRQVPEVSFFREPIPLVDHIGEPEI
jgi:hypothetical protein